MGSPYREGSHPAGQRACPRCQKQLPPLDVATCDAECGTWVTADIATIALLPDELVEDRLTRWWRPRAPCPVCSELMTVRGLGDGIFQGCSKHGFFVDAEVIRHTGLGRTGVVDEVERYRAAVETEHQRAAEAAEQARIRAEDTRIAAEQKRVAAEQARVEKAERAAEQERKAAEQRKTAEQRKAEAAAKKAEEKRARGEAKAAEKRAAAEAKQAARAQRRSELMARTREAIARGDADVLVDAMLGLEDRIEALEAIARKLTNIVTIE